MCSLTDWVIRGTWSVFQFLVLSTAPGDLQVLQKVFKVSSCQIALILANVTESFSFCHCGLPPWTKINLHARGKMDKGLLLKYKWSVCSLLHGRIIAQIQNTSRAVTVLEVWDVRTHRGAEQPSLPSCMDGGRFWRSPVSSRSKQ